MVNYFCYIELPESGTPSSNQPPPWVPPGPSLETRQSTKLTRHDPRNALNRLFPTDFDQTEEWDARSKIPQLNYRRLVKSDVGRLEGKGPAVLGRKTGCDGR